MLKKSRIIIAALCLCLIGFGKNDVSAFTKPLVVENGIAYPISLDNGSDSNGKVVFTDVQFLEYLKNATFTSGDYEGCLFDLNHDGKLSEDECDKVRVLSIENKKEIKSLDGVEAFPKLRELYCTGTGITRLDLTYNQRLQELYCGNTKIRELDLSKCTLLRIVVADQCQLAYLDVSNNQKLTGLTCLNQYIDGFEETQNGWYQVRLLDWGKDMALSHISNVKIDGGSCDGINSRYDALSGIVTCSDFMRQISYDYRLDLKGLTGEKIDTYIHVTMYLRTGLRETYETNGGSKVLPQYFAEGEGDIDPEIPTKTGYTFNGWYTDAECSTENKWEFGIPLTAPRCLYAAWSEKCYEVRYQLNGGFMNQSERKGLNWWSTDIIPRGTSIPVRQGYYLTGWRINDNKVIENPDNKNYTFGELAGKDTISLLTLSAEWKEKTGYSLSCQTNLPEEWTKNIQNFTEKLRELSWEDEISFYLEEDLEVVGYQFAGWYFDKEAKEKIEDGTTFADVYRSKYSGDDINYVPVLYACFTKNSYSIRYETGCKMKVAQRKNITWDTPLYLPKKKPKKRGYRFAGWQLVGGRRVIRGRKLGDVAYPEDSLETTFTIKAMWYKKYEKKGKIFSRYGNKYKIIRSNKKGNLVRLIKGKKKKVPKAVYYNGIRFRVVKK